MVKNPIDPRLPKENGSFWSAFAPDFAFFEEEFLRCLPDPELALERDTSSGRDTISTIPSEAILPAPATRPVASMALFITWPGCPKLNDEAGMAFAKPAPIEPASGRPLLAVLVPDLPPAAVDLPAVAVDVEDVEDFVDAADAVVAVVELL